MARFNKSPILDVMREKHPAPSQFGLEAKICEAIYHELNPERLEQIHLALRPIFSLVGEQLAISKKGLPKSPDFRKAIMEAKHDQLRLLEKIYDLGVSFECEQLVITLNEALSGELDRFQAIPSADSNFEAVLLDRMKFAWRELVPDRKWSFYRDDVEDSGFAGQSQAFVMAIVEHIPRKIRPSLRTISS